MSRGQRVPLAEAEAIAADLVDLLRPACERIEVAGSIRRRRATVGDIEIVAIPRIERLPVGILPDVTADVSLLDRQLTALPGRVWARAVEVHRADGTVDTQTREGRAYKALAFRELPVDLFITTADQWGVIFALRTGPWDWNVKLVEDCKRYFRRVELGRVLHLGQPVATPEERDFFRAIGQPWVEPSERSVARVAIVQPETLADGR